MVVATSIWTWVPTLASRYANSMNPTSSQMPWSCQSLTSSLGLNERGLFHGQVSMQRTFGIACFRDLGSICTVGFEPNIMHNDVLLELEQQYQDCGWQVNLSSSLCTCPGSSMISLFRFQDTSRHFLTMIFDNDCDNDFDRDVHDS